MPHVGEEKLSAYIDSQLDPGETRALDLHLAECESCRAILGDLREPPSHLRCIQPDSLAPRRPQDRG